MSGEIPGSGSPLPPYQPPAEVKEAVAKEAATPHKKPSSQFKHDVKNIGILLGGGLGAVLVGGAKTAVGVVGALALLAFSPFIAFASLADKKIGLSALHTFKDLTKDVGIGLGMIVGGSFAAAAGAAATAVAITPIGWAILGTRAALAPSKQTQMTQAQRLITEHALHAHQLGEKEVDSRVTQTDKGLEISSTLLVRKREGEAVPHSSFISKMGAPTKGVSPVAPMHSKYRVSNTEVETKLQGHLGAAEDHVAPTSAMGPHLTNCYVINVKDGGEPIIRCGVINTAEKAEEFGKVLRKMGNPPRVVSNQLNSPEVEEPGKRLISDQHYQMTKFTSDNPQIEIAHLNTPSNRFYSATKMLQENLGWVGKKLAAHFLNGEKYSLNQNVSGLGIYSGWVVEDLAGKMKRGEPVPNDMANLLAQDEELKAKKGEIAALVLDIGALEARVKELQKRFKSHATDANKALLKTAVSKLEGKRNELKTAREEMRSLLVTQHVYLERVEQIIADPVAKQKVMLMRSLLGSQLGIRPVSRGQEQLMMSALNHLLGVVEQNNCKSGLDRTGYRAAASTAIRQLLAGGKSMDDIVDMVTHWDETTRAMNMGKKVKGADDRVALISQYRELVFKNLVDFGLPITHISTGVFGLKYNKGFMRMQQNLLPLNFIPPKINVRSPDGNVKEHQLVKYGSNGEPERFSDMGEQLLLAWSAIREA